jgi:hypothetical protein
MVSVLSCVCAAMVLAPAILASAKSNGTDANQTTSPPAARMDFDQLTAAAEGGDAAAQLQLGLRYESGTAKRRAPDYDQAMKWFRAAADQGNAEAEARVGMLYHFGKGVPKDDAEAARWYRLAANGGYAWAALQLGDMYQRGVGVPRDQQEARKWFNVYKAAHPDHSVARDRMRFGLAALAVLAYAAALFSLQMEKLTGFPKVGVAIFVHLGGVALVANSLITYGFPLLFPHCAHDFLATACTQIADPHTRKIVNAFGDWSMVNLIFRFMAMVGFVLDGLAVWYLVYLWQRVFGRGDSRKASAGLHPLPSLPARNL